MQIGERQQEKEAQGGRNFRPGFAPAEQLGQSHENRKYQQKHKDQAGQHGNARKQPAQTGLIVPAGLRNCRAELRNWRAVLHKQPGGDRRGNLDFTTAN
jgi:hypothetical protein